MANTPTWREGIGAKIIEEVTNEDGGLWAATTNDDSELNEDDEFDCFLNEPVIKSSSEALKVLEWLAEFAQFGRKAFQRHFFVNDIIMGCRLREPRK